jgi:putative peptidoglycan lipid II flippase
MASAPPSSRIAEGIAGFAPGLLGYALFALLSRALYAQGHAFAAAGATALGWATAAGASLLFAALAPNYQRVAALGLANSVGMLVLGAALAAVVYRTAGKDALRGVARSLAAGVAGALLAIAAGLEARHLMGTTPGVGAALAQGMLCGGVVALVYGAVVAAVDRRSLQAVIARRKRAP